MKNEILNKGIKGIQINTTELEQAKISGAFTDVISYQVDRTINGTPIRVSGISNDNALRMCENIGLDLTHSDKYYSSVNRPF